MGGLAERLAVLCTQFGQGEVGEIASELGVAPTLARVLGAVRGDSGPWNEVALTADLDQLDAAFTRWGVDGGLTGQLLALRPLPNTGAHPRVVEVWMCPARRCSRVDPAVGGPAPVCAVTAGPCTLREVRT